MKIENTQTTRMKSVIWPKRNENDYNYEGMLCPKTKAGMTDLPSPWIEVLRVVKKQRIQMHGCDHRKHFPPTWNVITFQSFKHQKNSVSIYSKSSLRFSDDFMDPTPNSCTKLSSTLLPLYLTSFSAFLCKNLTTFPSLSVSLITFTTKTDSKVLAYQKINCKMHKLICF